MFVLDHVVEIGDKYFPAVKDIEIISSRATVSDMATIQLPKYKKLQPSDLKEGDTVVIRLGYMRYDLNDEFIGVIKEVSPSQPLTIKAEDYFAYLRNPITKVFKRMYAGDIIKQLCKDTPIDTSDIKMVFD